MVSLRLYAFSAGLLFAASPLAAFCPTDPACQLIVALGGSGRSHEEITRAAVHDAYEDFFGLTEPSDSMAQALDEIVEGNAKVDENQLFAELHFDGESFEAGQLRLSLLSDDVARYLSVRDAAAAREALGRALHSIQDFYSHSNWVELGFTEPSQELGRAFPTLSSAATRNTPTCGESIHQCNGAHLTTQLLTSGYYGGELTVPPAGISKCFHGGFKDSLATAEPGSTGLNGINKDLRNCLLSPHEQWHDIAARVAQAATLQFLHDVSTRLTSPELRMLYGIGPTFTVVVDTTGSMAATLPDVKIAVSSEIQSRINTEDEPSRYVLIALSDSGPITHLNSTSAGEFTDVLGSLAAAPTDPECQELIYHATLHAVHATDSGGDVWIFSDAAAKDESVRSLVDTLVTEKQISLHSVLLGSCDRVVVDPSQILLAVGASVPLRASVKTADGLIVATPAISWSTSDAAIATVSGDGVLLAVGLGTVEIMAAVAGEAVSGSATIQTFVHFPDANLNIAVRQALGVSNDRLLTQPVAAMLKELYAGHRGIQNLQGLEHFNNLERLELEHNKIADITFLADLRRLWRVGIANNQVSDLGPLSNLPSFRLSLSLSDNPVTSIAPLLLTKERLRTLSIGGGPIPDIHFIEKFTALEHLDVVRTVLTSIGFVQFMPALRALSVRNTGTSDLSPLGNKTLLGGLDIGENKVTDVRPLRSLTGLGVLWMDSNPLADISPLDTLTSLEFAYLHNTFISDVTVTANWTSLKVLDVRGSRISDISALVHNAGLGAGDTVRLGSNQLADVFTVFSSSGQRSYVASCGSYPTSCNNLAFLRDKGVSISVGSDFQPEIECRGGVPVILAYWKHICGPQ